jgi:hypothetical protein
VVCEILRSQRGTAQITPSGLIPVCVSMIVILVIGGIALGVALSLAAAIAPRKRPLAADVPPWPVEQRGHPVQRTEPPRDDLA